MKHLLTSFSLAASVVTASLALAQPGSTPDQRGNLGHHFQNGPFQRLDTNRDGKITRVEAKSASANLFTAMDANKDGSVSQQEARAAWEKQHQARRVSRFEAQDANSDGRLSRDESRMPSARFDQLDANHDGYVSRSEHERALPPAHARGRGRAALSRHDLDGDGKITRQEAEKAVDILFDRHDTNHDGVITTEEFRGSRRNKGRAGGADGRRTHRGESKWHGDRPARTPA